MAGQYIRTVVTVRCEYRAIRLHLSGAALYCVFENGHYYATTNMVVIVTKTDANSCVFRWLNIIFLIFSFCEIFSEGWPGGDHTPISYVSHVR